jgi:hypothetical protein
MEVTRTQTIVHKCLDEVMEYKKAVKCIPPGTNSEKYFSQ